jgi:hypothetical protein
MGIVTKEMIEESKKIDVKVVIKIFTQVPRLVLKLIR